MAQPNIVNETTLVTLGRSKWTMLKISICMSSIEVNYSMNKMQYNSFVENKSISNRQTKCDSYNEINKFALLCKSNYIIADLWFLSLPHVFSHVNGRLRASLRSI